MIVRVNTKCSKCKHAEQVTVDIEPLQLAPVNRSNLKPVSNIFEYRITSNDIIRYLKDKARKYSPEVKIEIAPRFIEKRRKNKDDKHASYAYLQTAFSENAISKHDENGWYGKIGESDDVDLITSIMKNFINRFKYNREALKKLKNDYKEFERFESSFGWNEGYLDDMIMFSNPRVVKTVNDERWVMFATCAELVIMEMLTIAEDGQLPGTVSIIDTIQISKDMVEYLVQVHSGKTIYEDSAVRRMLFGEEKPKKL